MVAPKWDKLADDELFGEILLSDDDDDDVKRLPKGEIVGSILPHAKFSSSSLLVGIAVKLKG